MIDARRSVNATDRSGDVLHPADEATATENLANQVGAVRSVGTA